MRMIEPSFEVIFPDSPLFSQVIERAGRTCYKSEEKITQDSAPKFVKKVISLGHESVIEHSLLTVRFVCDRGISHELVRHRLASFSQESTRYCNYSREQFDAQITVIRPFWVDYPDGEYGIELLDQKLKPGSSSPSYAWMNSCLVAEQTYMKLLESGWTPQQARSVLPNALKTEIVMSANYREWRHVLRLRTSSKAHPQMLQLMIPLRNYLLGLLPEVFDV